MIPNVAREAAFWSVTPTRTSGESASTCLMSSVAAPAFTRAGNAAAILEPSSMIGDRKIISSVAVLDRTEALPASPSGRGRPHVVGHRGSFSIARASLHLLLQETMGRIVRPAGRPDLARASFMAAAGAGNAGAWPTSSSSCGVRRYLHDGRGRSSRTLSLTARPGGSPSPLPRHHPTSTGSRDRGSRLRPDT